MPPADDAPATTLGDALTATDAPRGVGRAVGPSHNREYVSTVDAAFFHSAGARALTKGTKQMLEAEGAAGAARGGHKKHYKANRREKGRRKGGGGGGEYQ